MTTHQVETYIPLYRKYRPQSFSDLMGQDAISLTLGHALSLGKVAHAYLFCGPRGTGKTSSARIFAKSLNCEQGPTITPCQTCASCEGITQGNALDVIEFDAASNNGVEDARELIESCQFAPMAGRYKIYIIDEVHMLTTQAFNALLKTLEEPPPNVVFIFATTEAHKVLPTIISRCQRFDFNRITSEQIVNRLQTIAQIEAIAIDEETLWAIARHARGGLRDAVGLLDQMAVLGKVHPDTPLTQKDLLMLIGAIEEDVLFSMVEAIANREAPVVLAQLGQQINHGVEPTQLLKELVQHFRNLLLVKAVGESGDAKSLGLMNETFTRLVTQAKRFESAEIPQILNQLASLDRTVRNTQQPQLWLEVGLLELTFRQDIMLLSDLSQRVAQLEAQLAGGAKPVLSPSQAIPVQPVLPVQPVQTYQSSAQTSSAQITSPQPVAPVAASPVQVAPAQTTVPTAVAKQPIAPASTQVGGSYSWQDICAKVASIPTKALLNQHFFLIKVDGNHLTIGTASEANLNTVKRPDKFIHLQKAADGLYGQPMTVQLVLDKTPNRQASMGGAAAAPSQSPDPALPPAQVSGQSQTQASPHAPVLASEIPPTIQPVQPLAPEPPASSPVQPTMAAAVEPDFDVPPDDMPPDEDLPPFEEAIPQAPVVIQSTAIQATVIQTTLNAQVALGEAMRMVSETPSLQPVQSDVTSISSEPESSMSQESVLPEPVFTLEPVTPALEKSFDGSDLGPNDSLEWEESRKFSLELLQGKVMDA
jgi:DNA polymerase III subunit gamma/tau